MLAVGLAIASYRLPVFGDQLYAPQNTFAFGTVAAGKRVSHTFLVRNLHPWPVTINSVQGGCGCTRAVLERDPPVRLLPFQDVHIQAILDTEQKSGPLQQVVRVTTSDNPKGSQLILEGSVLPHPQNTGQNSER